MRETADLRFDGPDALEWALHSSGANLIL